MTRSRRSKITGVADPLDRAVGCGRRLEKVLANVMKISDYFSLSRMWWNQKGFIDR